MSMLALCTRRPLLRCAFQRRWQSSPVDNIAGTIAAQGKVSVEQFLKMLKVQGCNYTEEQLDALVKRVDSNADGFISMSEYEEFLYPVGFGDGDVHDEAELTESERRHLRSIDV